MVLKGDAKISPSPSNAKNRTASGIYGEVHNDENRFLDSGEYSEQQKHDLMVEWYQRRFQLWIPHEQALENEDDDDELKVNQ